MSSLKISDRVLTQFSPEEQRLLRPMTSQVLGMEVMVKFHRNTQEDQVKRNPWVSWTLNKIAVVDRTWVQQHPGAIDDMTWWRAKVEAETRPGEAAGAFVVRPLWRVERHDLVMLAPSTWDQVQKGATVILYPKMKPWLPWIMPRALRRLVMKQSRGSALAIPLSYPPEGQPSRQALEPPSYLGMQIPTDLEEEEL